MIELIQNNLVLILLVAFCVLKGVWGYHKGFIKMIASFAGMVLSLLISQKLAPMLAARMRENNAWVTWVQAEILPRLKIVTMDMVFSAVSFLVLFILASVLIRVLVSVLEKAAEQPVLSVLNQTLGMIFGVAESIVYIWVFMLFVDIMPQLPVCQTISAQIAADELLTIIHDNNLLILGLQSVLQKGVQNNV